MVDFNGDMLRLARQRKGFHQTEAASRLKVTQPLLSRYENKLAIPREDFITLAAQAYEVKRSFFFQSDPIYGPPVSIHPMWRKKADVSARDLDGIVAELNIRAMHLRRFLEAVDVRSGSPLPRLDIDEYADADEVAGVLRAHWGVPRGPLGNLTVLAERAGVLVAHSAMSGAHVSGVTFSPPGLPPLVVLNSDQPADRMRWTLAHELGHLVMHRFPTANMEEEANKFAAALLMPERDVRPYFNGRKIDLALVASMKPEWKVSMQALLMRAKNLGFTDRNREEYLWKQMNARRWRLREPHELDFEMEMPSVAPNLFRVFRESLGYSMEEASSLLHLPEGDVAEFYGISDAGRNPFKLALIP